MWLRVAALLGGRTVEEWQEVMTSAEFEDWCAFYEVEPWGFDAEGWRTGMIAATVANYAGRCRKKPDAKPSDFQPRRRRKATQRENAAAIKAYIEQQARKNG